MIIRGMTYRQLKRILEDNNIPDQCIIDMGIDVERCDGHSKKVGGVYYFDDEGTEAGKIILTEGGFRDVYYRAKGYKCLYNYYFDERKARD